MIVKKHYQIIILIFISVFSVWLRMPYFGVSVLTPDESVYSEIANLTLDGKVLYKDACDNKPPGIFFIYSSIFRVFGKNNLYAVHWISAIFIVLTGIVLYLLISLFAGKSASLLSAGMMMMLPSFSRMPVDFQAANAEIFMLLPMVLSLFLFCLSLSRKINLLGAGFFVSLSMLIKQPGIFLLPMFILLILFSPMPNNRADFLKNLSKSIYLLIGFALPLFFTMGYFYLRDALGDFIYYVFTYNTIFTHDIPLQLGVKIAYLNTKYFIGSNDIIYLLAVLQFLYMCNAQFIKKSYAKSDNCLICIFFFIVSLIMLSLGWRFSGHYYVMIFPAVSILYGLFFDNVLRLVRLIEKKILKRVLYTFTAMTIVASLSYPLIASTGFPPRSNLEPPYMRISNARGDIIKSVSSHINSHTSDDDTVFSWGFFPEVYTLSNRRSASRFVHCNFLVGDILPYPRYFRLDRIKIKHWDQLVDDLKQNMPEYIVDTAPANHLGFKKHRLTAYPILHTFINKYYLLETTIGKMDLYRLKQIDEEHE